MDTECRARIAGGSRRGDFPHRTRIGAYQRAPSHIDALRPGAAGTGSIATQGSRSPAPSPRQPPMLVTSPRGPITRRNEAVSLPRRERRPVGRDRHSGAGGRGVVRVGFLRRFGAGACPNLPQRRSAAGSAARRGAEYQRFSSHAPARSGPLWQIWTTSAAAGPREGRRGMSGDRGGRPLTPRRAFRTRKCSLVSGGGCTITGSEEWLMCLVG